MGIVLRAAPSGEVLEGTSSGQVLIWNETTREWDAGSVVAPTAMFMLEVDVGNIGSLDPKVVSVLDPRFAFEPAPGAERLPITASLTVNDPGPLMIQSVVLVESGEVAIRFFNGSDAAEDFTTRFITFWVWPPVAEPAAP